MTLFTNDSFFLDRFGVISAIESVQEVLAGDEFLTNYSFSFDEAPPWYKDLILWWLEKHPGESNIVTQAVNEKSKEELLKIYEDYLKR